MNARINAAIYLDYRSFRFQLFKVAGYHILALNKFLLLVEQLLNFGIEYIELVKM
jgi:hypothetical protein